MCFPLLQITFTLSLFFCVQAYVHVCVRVRTRVCMCVYACVLTCACVVCTHVFHLKVQSPFTESPGVAQSTGCCENELLGMLYLPGGAQIQRYFLTARPPPLLA